VVNEQIRLAAFDLIGDIDEIQSDPETKKTEIADMLYKLSRGLKELESAEKLNAERTEGIRKAALAEAAEVVKEEAKSAGVDDAKMEIIRRKIIGLCT